MLLKSFDLVFAKVKLHLFILILSFHKVSLDLLCFDLLLLLQYDLLAPLMVLYQRLVEFKLFIEVHQLVFESLQD
jgi:hypothetical protein